MEEQVVRINKFLSESGFCSRREADKLLEQGRITINGKLPELGTKVSPGDEVRVNGKLVSNANKKHTYLAFHKPVGIECTTNQKVKDNIVDYIAYPERVFPIGRLDKASEGLIFMTSDGDIVNKILRARNNHEKEYIVTVNRPITDDFIYQMSNGLPILDTITKKCKVERISQFVFRIILTQGLNRQIRRMCEYLNYEVTALKRIRIINITLDVPIGKYRHLTEQEIKQLNDLIAPSSKTEEASIPKNKKPTTEVEITTKEIDKMNKKDINFEVERFLKGNYQKNVALELLRKDGFSEEEIQKQAYKFDQLRRNPDNSLSFFPPFLFLILASISTLTLTLKEENEFKLITSLLFLCTLITTYFFSKKNKQAIITTAFLAILFMLLLAYLFIISAFGMGKLITIELFLIFTLFSIKRYYKKVSKI